MADYNSKYSGEQVEALLDQVASGNAGGGGGGGTNITIDTELSETSNNAVANSAVTKGLSGKQDTLILEAKPNGNIVIGNLDGQSKEFMPSTPSGDPMHYAYEAAGAVFNDTEAPLEKKDWFGRTITHESQKWYLNGLGDISNKEMAKIYSLGRFSPSTQCPLGYGSNSYPDYATTVRTNIARLGMYNGTVTGTYFACVNYVIETINVSTASQTPKGTTTVNSSNAFNNCHKLRSIYGDMRLNGDALTTFVKCYKLEDMKILDLSVNISFADSPLLSKESLLYMINNCASNATFTITLHPDVYAKCVEGGEWYSSIDDEYGDYTSDSVNKQIQLALTEKGTTITLASA